GCCSITTARPEHRMSFRTPCFGSSFRRGRGLRQDRDDPGQFAWSDRLLNVVLEPCAQDPGPLLGTGESREGSGGRRAATPRWQPANLADEPIAVLVGHLQVAPENIWALVRADRERRARRFSSATGGRAA